MSTEVKTDNIPKDLRLKCEKFLDLSNQIDALKAEMDKVKEDLILEFKNNPATKSVKCINHGYSVQNRETIKNKYDVDGIFKKIAQTQFLEVIFPKKFDPSNLTEEDVLGTHLYSKCITRKLDEDTLTDFLVKNILNLTEFVSENLLQVNKTNVIAKVKIKEK